MAALSPMRSFRQIAAWVEVGGLRTFAATATLPGDTPEAVLGSQGNQTVESFGCTIIVSGRPEYR